MHSLYYILMMMFRIKIGIKTATVKWIPRQEHNCCRPHDFCLYQTNSHTILQKPSYVIVWQKCNKLISYFSTNCSCMLNTTRRGTLQRNKRHSKNRYRQLRKILAYVRSSFLWENSYELIQSRQIYHRFAFI